MEVKKRSEIDDKFKWRLEDIFETNDAWQKAFNELEKHTDDILQFEGKLNNAKDILACLRFSDEQELELTRLYSYARMRQDQDVSEAVYQEMCDKLDNLMVKMSSISSFIMPELTSNSREFILDLANKEEFKDYDYMLKELARNKERTLSQPEEKLIAESSSFSDLFHDAFTMIDNADIDFKEFTDSKGNKVKLSHGLYGLYMQSENREDRRKAFEAMFNAYKGLNNTLAVLYAGNVKKDLFYTRARKYNTCLEKSMDNENVTPLVYKKLVECVDKNLPKLHKYLNYRADCLGYDKVHMYDLHNAIVPQGSIKADYEESKQLVLKAMAPLGEEYIGLLKEAFNNGWIDVYENKGKKSGAYSWGCYGVHPYVLLNHTGTIHDIFTIAHELGHSMHTYYSNKNQPYSKADYEIFVAEVASTVNETLLQRYLAKNCDKSDRKYLCSYMLDMFRTTVFRQTQFAEFEVVAHTMAEQGKPLTADSLNKAYYDLNKKYYGAERVVNDELIQYEWSRIPHFYRSFYVYKYATGLISAVCIADRILTEGQPAVDDYKKFLSAGGSMPPVEILKLAGVDLTTDAPYEKAMKFFESQLDELMSL